MMGVRMGGGNCMYVRAYSKNKGTTFATENEQVLFWNGNLILDILNQPYSKMMIIYLIEEER